MNKILLILLISSFSAYSQEKTYTDSTGTYTIKYQLKDSTRYWIPYTLPPGHPHYEATITVFKDSVMIGKPFEGTYVKEGCFEDKPSNHVTKARQE